MLALQAEGAHNINLVSPSHVIFQIADAIEIARTRGLQVPIVYNSGGYDSVAALRRIAGLIQIYLPDLKYASQSLSQKLSKAPDYPRVAMAAIEEMFTQVGELRCDREGIAQSGILVRHLVLPGQLENSKRCLRFLASLSREIHLSIMSQYTPREGASPLAGLARGVSAAEYEEIIEIALALGLENVFVQELSSQGNYLPDFERATPFQDQTGSEVEVKPTLG
jgi:putative pyruvate formate lyase activating enzyme